MSEINLDFNLSNIVQNITVEPITANVEVGQIDLTLTTQPLNITVEGTGAYYTGAINNNPVAYTAANVLVPVPPITLSAATSNFAVAEFTVSGSTTTGTGTAAQDFVTFTGATPVRGTVPTYASANFSTSGVTPPQVNDDATRANAVITFSGNSSTLDGGSTTKYIIDALATIAADDTTSWSIIVPAYGQYPQLSTTVNFANGDNAIVALTKVQANLTNLRPTFSFVTSNYSLDQPNVTQTTRFLSTRISAVDDLTSIAVSNTGTALAFFTENERTTTPNAAILVGNIGNATQSVSNVVTSYGTIRTNFPTKSAWNNGTWVVSDITFNNVTQLAQQRVWTSTNGTSWSSYNVGPSVDYANIGYLDAPSKIVKAANGIFFTSGVTVIGNVSSNDYYSTVYSSPTGTTWTSGGYTLSGIWTSIASDGANYVITTSTNVFKSSNIANLISVGSRVRTSGAYDVTWTGSQWVTVNSDGIVQTSPNADSNSWTTRTSGATRLYSVAHDNTGNVMAVGGNRIVYSENHGNTWTTLTNPTGGNITTVIYDSAYDSGFGRFILSGPGNTVWQAARTNYRRLEIDTNYTITGGNLLISPVNITGSNTTPIWSTVQGTATAQPYDVINFTDGVNGQTLQMAYNQDSEAIAADVLNRFSVFGWTASYDTANSVLLTRNTPGLIDLAEQITANYSISAGSGAGNAAANRTSSYQGTNNTTNPQPTLQLDLDGAIATVNLPYNTNLATITNYPELITPLGWTVTQPVAAGEFTITNDTLGVVSNIGGVILNAPLATITRTAYNNGSTTISDPNTPYLEIQFDQASGINPNPYRIYLPWDTPAVGLADFVRRNGSAFGIEFGGTTGTASFVMTATNIGPQAQPVFTRGGTGTANWNVSDIYTNGTGSSGVNIIVDEGGIINTFPILGNRNPQQIITDFITAFYSDRWRIIRTGSNQFSLVAIQLGPQTQPVITTNVSPPTIELNSWTNGTIPSGTIPGYSINIGRIGVILPGITLVQN